MQPPYPISRNERDICVAGSRAIENGIAHAIPDGVCDELVQGWFTKGSKKMLIHPHNSADGFVLSGEIASAHLRTEITAWRESYAAFGQTLVLDD